MAAYKIWVELQVVQVIAFPQILRAFSYYKKCSWVLVVLLWDKVTILWFQISCMVYLSFCPKCKAMYKVTGESLTTTHINRFPHLQEGSSDVSTESHFIRNTTLQRGNITLYTTFRDQILRKKKKTPQIPSFCYGKAFLTFGNNHFVLACFAAKPQNPQYWQGQYK